MCENPIRYSVIEEKNPREILMLRGKGCGWRRCTFCDYHQDFSLDEEANYTLNLAEIKKVTGTYHHLEVINSGSFCELDDKTLDAIRKVCKEKEIHTIHFETHWMYRRKIAAFRQSFASIGTTVKLKIGVETFDESFREKVFHKGMPHATPEEIASYCDEVCLLFGIHGQTEASMRRDVETGLSHFDRVCINIMVPNTTKITPDSQVIQTFKDKIYPDYISNPRVDILMNNTDFGVGGEDSSSDVTDKWDLIFDEKDRVGGEDSSSHINNITDATIPGTCADTKPGKEDFAANHILEKGGKDNAQ